MLKAIIFDMDGVIVDTEPQHLRAMIEAGKQFGADLEYKYCEQFIGCNSHDTLSKLAADYPQLSDIDAFNKEFNRLKIEIRDREGLIPIEGTIRLLKSLHDKNVKVGIASSSAPYEISHVVETLNLSSYIDEIISGSMVKHSKPEPDIFLLAAKQLGVDPDECIIVEDSMNGSIAASRANITCIGYQTSHSGNQDLSRTCCIYEDMMALDYDAVVEEYNRSHGLPVEMLHTDRLLIKELSVDDITQLYELYKDKENTRFLPGLDSLEEEQEKHKAYITHVYNYYRFGLWGIYLNSTKKLIGRAGLQCIDIDDITEIELGYLIGTKYQRQGYAYECCKAILDFAKEIYEFPSVVALISADNAASISLAKKLGFTFERNINKENTEYELYRVQLS